MGIKLTRFGDTDMLIFVVCGGIFFEVARMIFSGASSFF